MYIDKIAVPPYLGVTEEQEKWPSRKRYSQAPQLILNCIQISSIERGFPFVFYSENLLSLLMTSSGACSTLTIFLVLKKKTI